MSLSNSCSLRHCRDCRVPACACFCHGGRSLARRADPLDEPLSHNVVKRIAGVDRLAKAPVRAASPMARRTPVSVGISTADVMEATGASYRQLDYWARTGAVGLAQNAAGSGTRREWSFESACEAAALKRLSESGVQIGRVSSAVCPWPRQGGILIVHGLHARVVAVAEDVVVALRSTPSSSPLVLLDLDAIAAEVRSFLGSDSEVVA